jgi:hypothetical protein
MTTDLDEQVRRAFREAPVPAPDPQRAARVRQGARARRRRSVVGGLSVGVAAALAAVPVGLAVQDLRTPAPGAGTVVAAGPVTEAALPSPDPTHMGGELLDGTSRRLTPADRTFSFVVVPKGPWVELTLGCQALTSERTVQVTAALDGRPRLTTSCNSKPSYRSSAPVDMVSSPTKVVPGKAITVTVTTGFATSPDPTISRLTPLDRAVRDGVVVAAVYDGKAPDGA